jgi:SAM-dependent methyltransferase
MSIHQRFSTNPYGWTRWVMEHLHLQAGMRVLELGCGTAALWRENLNRLPDSIEVTLSDYSSGMFSGARRELADDPRFRFLQADAQAIPFPANTFDLVIANHMLYHVPDIQQALKEIRRVLKPGGRLAAATNGAGHLAELHQLLSGLADEPITSGAVARFGLQNGDRLLAEVFPQRELFIYPDSLWVTEIEPLIAYIRSMWWVEGWGNEMLARLEHTISQHIRERGGFAVQKSSGLFWAGGEG